MKQHGQEPVSFADVKDEIFDMVKPEDPLKITLQVHIKLLKVGILSEKITKGILNLAFQDLINSGQGETVTNILIDLNGFWTYENREVLVTDPNNDDDL